MLVQIVDTENKKVGEIQLSESSSDKINKAALYYAVKALLNNKRHGTASVKERGEVNKTNKKIYRQKGTGQARHGASSANIFVGGGVVHGPRPRSYREKINKKFNNLSYREAFKYLLQIDGLRVIKEIDFEKPSTKAAQGVIKNLGLTKALVVLPQNNLNGHLSFRNLKNVRVVNENNINVYDMLRMNAVVLTAKIFESMKERYSL